MCVVEGMGQLFQLWVARFAGPRFRFLGIFSWACDEDNSIDAYIDAWWHGGGRGLCLRVDVILEMLLLCTDMGDRRPLRSGWMGV